MSDQEPSILDLNNKVVAELGGSHDVIVDASPVNEHPPNGVVQRAVQTHGGMIRTHKLALEPSYSKELEADDVLVLWLIMHAAGMVSLFELGSDGRTAYERSQGKPYRNEFAIFGECVCVFRPSVGQDTRAERTSWKRSHPTECISD